MMGDLTEYFKMYLSYLKSSSFALRDYIDGILKYYKNDDLLKLKKETIAFKTLVLEAKKITVAKNNAIINFNEELLNIKVNKSAILQILVNLITNAIKYCDKEFTEITLDVKVSSSHYNFSVKDNGKGIAANKLHSIFDLFTTLIKKMRLVIKE
ncbi:MAG: HAMP domain-containing sensor histidine kinase [Lacinutrix sp.]|uniref:HAMP domain-containing sensor histidine kinase n=1 Tax=Lacinutrix sp. TaxID=1937692 RepID=UPI003097CBE7